MPYHFKCLIKYRKINISFGTTRDSFTLRYSKQIKLMIYLLPCHFKCLIKYRKINILFGKFRDSFTLRNGKKIKLMIFALITTLGK